MPAETSSESHDRLNLKSYEEEGAWIVECEGRLTLENAARLKTEVKGMIPQHKRIILDLEKLVFMDSSGLGTVVGLYVSARNSGCKVELCNMSKPIRELLGMSQLLSVFEACGRYGMRM
jgi:anti-sigma B factor antagonist